MFTILAACSSAPPATLRNPPTLAAPTRFVEAETPVSINNIANLRYLGRLDQPGVLSTVFADAISPDATRLVGLNNDQLLAWNLLDGSLIFQTARSGVTHVFYGSDKTEIYGVDGEGTVGVYDANTGALKTSFSGSGSYSSVVAYSSARDWLAVGGRDGSVKLWDTYARQALVTRETNGGAITALVFSPDGNQLAGSDSSGQIYLWNERDQAPVSTLAQPADNTANVVHLAFAPDGTQIAIGTNRDARLWDLLDNTSASAQASAQASVLDVGDGGASQILRYSPDGSFLLAGNRNAGLSLWNPVTDVLAARLPDTQGDTISAAFSPDSNLLLTTTLGGQVSLWNLVQLSGSTVAQSKIDVGTDRVLSVEWTDDGRLLLFFDSVGPVYLWGVG